MKKIIFLIVAFILILAFGYVYLNYIAPVEEEEEGNTDITSFEECVDAGYPVMESYPRQCKTPDGTIFTEELSAEDMEGMVVENVLPQQYKANSSTFIKDLNEDGNNEIIISGATTNNLYISVVTLSDGGYQEIGAMQDQGSYRGTPTVESTNDIDKDGEEELFIDLASGGASTVAKGIINVNFSEGQVNFLKLQDEKGDYANAVFYIGGSVTHQSNYEITDLDENGENEIVETGSMLQYSEPQNLDPWETTRETDGNTWLCYSKVYEWNGAVFSYSENLSIEATGMLDENCSL